MMGLAAIPFIVHPIDEGVHGVLDLTLRPLMRGVICKQMQVGRCRIELAKQSVDQTALGKSTNVLCPPRDDGLWVLSSFS